MSVITVILNYNGKHTEVLFERLVGSQPTHPFAHYKGGTRAKPG